MTLLMFLGREKTIAQTYCTPTPAPTTATYYINSFSTTGGITNISNNNTGMSAGGYGNFTAMSCSAVPGGTISFASSFYSSSTFGARIWLDWNHDGDFDDAGEQVFATSGYVSSISGTISIPTTASGPTRMRIRIHWLSSTGPVACNETNNSTYVGEAEDYTLLVVPPNNAGVSALITPDNTPKCTNSSYDVSVSVKNLGGNTLSSASINWSLNGVMQVPVTLPVPLANYGDSAVVTLGSVFIANTTPIQLKAWTDMPNGTTDPMHADDSISKSIAATLLGVEVNITPRDTTICQGTTITLDAGTYPKNPIYIWSNATLTQTLDVSNAGVYSVKVQNTDGCFDYDTVTISTHPNPLVNSIAMIDNADGSYTFNVIGAQNITSYLWEFGDGETQAGTGMPGQIIHQYLNAGIDTVTLTLSNDCGSVVTTRIISTKGVSTGIGDVSRLQATISLFPNPSRSVVTISNTAKIKIKALNVFNIMGQKVYENGKINAEKYEMNISNLATGIYNVVIETEEGRVTKKLEVIK